MHNTPIARLLACASFLICLGEAIAAEPPPAVVRIYCNGVAGAGVVHGDRMHVLTAFSTVRSGRPTEVIFADGQSIDASTVAVDPDAGLALLVLESAAPAEPLTVQATSLAAGATIHGLLPADTPFDGPERTLPPAQIAGTIAAVGTAGLRVALPVPADGVGAPVLNSAGQLVGLARSAGPIAEVVPAARFSTLLDSAKAEPDGRYRGQGVFMLRAGWLLRADDGGVSQGPRVSADVVLFDRFGLSARIGTLFGDAPGGDPAFLAGAETIGMVADLELNGRFGIVSSAPLQIVGGLGMTRVTWSSRGHVLDGDRLAESRVDGDLLRPYARIGLGITDMVEFGYSLEVDFDDPGQSAHRFGLSIGF